MFKRCENNKNLYILNNSSYRSVKKKEMESFYRSVGIGSVQ